MPRIPLLEILQAWELEELWSQVGLQEIFPHTDEILENLQSRQEMSQKVPMATGNEILLNYLTSRDTHTSIIFVPKDWGEKWKTCFIPK